MKRFLQFFCWGLVLLLTPLATGQAWAADCLPSTAPDNQDSTQMAILEVLKKTCSNTNAPDYAAASPIPVVGTFTSPGNGLTFTPVAGRSFNLTIYATGGTAPGSTLNATIYLTRSTDGGTTFLPITAVGTGIYSFTSLANESLYESQTGVIYRPTALSVTSGTVNYRFTQ